MVLQETQMAATWSPILKIRDYKKCYKLIDKMGQHASFSLPQKKHVWPKMNVEVCFSRQLNEHRVFLNDQHHVLGGHSNLRGLCKDMCC